MLGRNLQTEELLVVQQSLFDRINKLIEENELDDLIITQAILEVVSQEISVRVKAGLKRVNAPELELTDYWWIDEVIGSELSEPCCYDGENPPTVEKYIDDLTKLREKVRAIANVM